MKQFFLFFILNSLPYFGLAQRIPNSTMVPNTADSVRLIVAIDRNKELLMPGQDESYEIIGSCLLNQKERGKFLKKLRKKSSYDNGRALLTHHSLIFKSYSEGQLTVRVEISTLTNNIDIYREGEAGFFGKISKNMGTYLVKLLTRLNLFEKLHQLGDTEGIMK